MSLLRKLIGTAFAFLGLLYAIYFSMQNLESVFLEVPLIGSFRVSGFVAYLALFAAGFVVATAYFVLDSIKKSFELRRLRRQVTVETAAPQRRARKFLAEDVPEDKQEPTYHSEDSKIY